ASSDVADEISDVINAVKFDILDFTATTTDIRSFIRMNTGAPASREHRATPGGAGDRHCTSANSPMISGPIST
ncbi:hypothetical protein, partial [Microbacterium sp. K21]|uniref:hypothetical protein n=1 Tax=Microbacterium sp. K21 TaxID=2305448 RepID=UPI00197BDBE0